MNFPAKLGLAASTAAAVAILIASAAAQTASTAKSFEVATIRSASLPTPESFRGGQFRTGTTIDKSRADFEFVTLADLIPYAYRVKSFQMAGPASLRETRWNIVATLPAGSTQDQVPDMVQALLVDRFGLKVHHEKREQPVYELTVAKGGPKLAAAVPGDSASSDAGSANLPGLGGPFPFGGRGRGPEGRGDGPPGDGRGGRGFAFGNGDVQISPNESDCGINLEFKKLTMSSLADTLTPFLDRPVLDSTGLKGTYQASMKLPMEVMFGMIQNQIRNANLPLPPGGFDGGRGGPGGFDGAGRGGRGPGNCDPGQSFNANSGDTSNAALFQAVQQLGLKLQAKKAPFDTIVVDHVEKTPSDN